MAYLFIGEVLTDTAKSYFFFCVYKPMLTRKKDFYRFGMVIYVSVLAIPFVFRALNIYSRQGRLLCLTVCITELIMGTKANLFVPIPPYNKA